MEIDFTNETIGEYISRIMPTRNIHDLSDTQMKHLAAIVLEDGERDIKEADEIRQYVQRRTA